jgi:hypothetical protein
MIVTQYNVYVQELELLITAEIDRLKDEMSSGLLKTYEDYRSYSGKIQGLRACLEFMEDASSSVQRKLS